MIFAISGKVVNINRNSVVVSTEFGIEYEVFAHNFDLTKITVGNNYRWLISEIIKEDSYTLYGFLSESSQKMFYELIKVNGIGPKVAMTILSQLTIGELINCVQTQTLPALMTVKGLGKKGAEKLMLALKDKCGRWVETSQPLEHVTDATEALITLGYDRNKVIKIVKPLAAKTTDVKQIITLALRQLSQESV